MQQLGKMERWLRPKGWPGKSQKQVVPASVLRRGSVHHLREKGGFRYEATTAPGQPLCRRAGWAHLSRPWVWEQVDLLPRPALALSLGLSLLIPRSHVPSPCLLAGAWEGTVGTSQRTETWGC